MDQIIYTLIFVTLVALIIRSTFKKKRKDWHKPLAACYPVIEKGDVVVWQAGLYVITSSIPNIACGRGNAGPACFLALGQDGCITSITNWDCQRIK